MPENTRPCCMCKKQLDLAIPGEDGGRDEWSTLQPYAGGEIQLIFGFGSTKFDHMLEGAVFRGIICDDCAEKIVPNLFIVNKTNHPFHGDLAQYNTELPK